MLAKKILRRGIALTLTTIVLASLPPAPARAASRVHTVTIGTLVGESKPETQVWHFIRDRIESRLPGRFAFRIVANAALGVGEKELVEGMQLE